MEKLKLKLLKFGNPRVLKEGLVFTVLITGDKLSNWKNVEEIQRLIIEHTADKYPHIEVLVNDDNFFCMVLKPKPCTENCEKWQNLAKHKINLQKQVEDLEQQLIDAGLKKPAIRVDYSHNA
jgi:hypothetical protein